MKNQTPTLGFTIVCLLLIPWFEIRAAEEKTKPAPPANEAKDSAEADSGKETPDPGKQPIDRYFAITGSTVHTITGPVVDGPTVLCKNGKIAEIGHDLRLPKNTEILDAKGYHMYPGLVAIQSQGILGNEPPEDNTDLYNLSMTLGLANGITTAVTGNTAAKLTFGTVEGHVLRQNLFHTLQYSTENPDGRRKFRESLERARQYLRDLDDHEKKKKHDPKSKPPTAPKNEDEKALKLLKHELVALATVNTAQALNDLAGLAEQYGFQLVVQGAAEGWIVAPQMARAGVRACITPRTRRDRDERTNHPNGSSIENARILHEHGILFAIIPSSTGITTMGLAGRDLMHLPMEAAFAVRGGLPDEVAVRAITIDAARILGIDHHVGSIEVGKDADFAIVDGDLLHYMTLVRWAIVNGRIAYDKQKDSLLDHIRPDGQRDAPPPYDPWPRRLGEDW
ncbi:MAG: amidohydrolase family protein [Pirellulales bacterium]|nr:amidohydrolase family protein [Pirellulales bacterium]